MFRVFVSIVFFAYCSSLPFSGSNSQRFVPIASSDESELVDNVGAGYSYFSRQDIETQPIVPISNADFSGKIRTNTIQQLPLMARSNLPLQTLPQKTIAVQQPVFLQNDRTQVDLPTSSGFITQQLKAPIQSSRLIQNQFNNPPKQDVKTIDSLQILLPRTNLNTPFKTFNNVNNQQPLIVPPKSQSTWSEVQKSTGFSSFVSGPNQQPKTSSFLIQSNQQNDKVPVTNALFVSSPLPPRRLLSQSQSTQPLSSNVWQRKQ